MRLGAPGLLYAWRPSLAGCRQDMQDQPKYIPLRPSTFFDDGRSERPLVEGTVARGHLDADTAFYTGKIDGKPVDAFPFPITARSSSAASSGITSIARRAMTAWAPAMGMVVRRGYRQPPSLPHRAFAESVRGIHFRRDHRRIRRHAGLRRADSALRPLGHRGLRARAAIQPERFDQRRAAGGPRPACTGGPSKCRPRLNTRSFAIPAELAGELRGWRTRSLLIGAAALILCVIGGFFNADQFFRSYLWCYMFYIGVALGSTALLMLQYLTGGAWGMVIRRPCEAAARTFPCCCCCSSPSSSASRTSISGRTRMSSRTIPCCSTRRRI